MKDINYKLVTNTLGIALVFESMFMLVDIPISLLYGGTDVYAIGWSFVITLAAGGAMVLSTYRNLVKEPGLRDSFLVVVLVWLFISLFGTLPYLISHSIPRFVDAFFETVSGFTTTGSSILVDIEALPKGILFWRAETHWLGGMGIIVLVIAIMPYFRVGGQHLMVAEGSFFGVDKIKPRFIDVAKRLWFIYLVLTVAETLLLMAGGMDWFDSVCHSFATVATGGFSTKNTSAMEFSPYIQYVLIVFMALSGMNFSLHYFFFHKKWKAVFKNEEFLVYWGILILVSLFLANEVRHFYHGDLEEAFRQSLFQVVSIITATGFSSADYSQWPPMAILVIFFIMFIGASVGSTGGGIKVARHLIMFKNARRIFHRMISRHSVVQVRYNNQVVSERVILSIYSFVFIYFLTFLIGSIIMMATGLDYKSAFSSVITTLGGIGPGLGKVGPANNFSGITDFGKYYLSFNMILGRLEILSVLAIFTPSFYKT